MKLTRMITTVLGASLLLAVGAMAQEKGTLSLSEKVTVQGTELKPGSYNLEWTGTGPSVELTITHGKDVVKVPATLVPRETPNKGNGYGAKADPSGVRALLAIYPAGKKYGVEIGQQAAAN